MRILVSIACWNAADIICVALDAVLQQTLAVEEILVVDNASTDGLANSDFPDIVTLVRNRLNMGMSGAVATGFEYARARRYDWVWLLDADSRPRPNTLELLTRLAAEAGGDIGIVGPSHNLLNLGRIVHGRMLTPGGPRRPRLRQDQKYVACDATIWCGALMNLAVVERLGLPRTGTLGYWEDLSCDHGDIEYSYRIRRAGYKILVHLGSFIDHQLGSGLHGRILGWDFYSTNHPAFRRYLYFRNLVFFWLRLYPRRNWPMLFVWFGYRLSKIVTGIVLLERERGTKLRACLVGVRDGFIGRMNENFE